MKKRTRKQNSSGHEYIPYCFLSASLSPAYTVVVLAHFGACIVPSNFALAEWGRALTHNHICVHV